MIGRLCGRLIEKRPPALLVDVNGVGYELEAPMSTFDGLPAVGEEVTLRTHLAVREDAHTLYGFHDERERSAFRSLIRVSGIGPRLALTLLSGLHADELIRCVERRDVAMLKRVPGIGKKTAERIIMELQDRVRELGPPPADAVAGANTTPAADAVGDAVSALVALGYKPAEAGRLLAGIRSDDSRDSETLIRLALQKAMR